MYQYFLSKHDSIEMSFPWSDNHTMFYDKDS